MLSSELHTISRISLDDQSTLRWLVLHVYFLFLLSCHEGLSEFSDKFIPQSRKELYRPVTQHLLTLYESAWVVVIFVKYFLILKTSQFPFYEQCDDQRCRCCKITNLHTGAYRYANSSIRCEHSRERKGGWREGQLFCYGQKTSWTGSIISRRKRRYSR